MNPRVLWPANQLPDAITALVRHANLPFEPVATPPGSTDAPAIIRTLGLEPEPVRLNAGPEMTASLARLAPGIIALPNGEGYLAITGARGSKLQTLAPDLSTRTIATADLTRELRRPSEPAHRDQVNQLLNACGLPADSAARTRAYDALINERLHGQTLATAVQLRIPPGKHFAFQLHHAGLFRRTAAFLTAHLLEYIALLAAWAAIGAGALSGRIDYGWLSAWACLLVTMIPLRAWTTWSQGMLAIGAGGLLKQRLLAGALTLDPDLMRSEGAGELLGRVNESETLEMLALSGGLTTLLAAIELAVSGLVIASGSAAVIQFPAFLAWLGFCGFLAVRYFHRRSKWAAMRLTLTHHLVENMTGHRTRLAQQPIATWHDGEDEELSHYLKLSDSLDRAGARLTALGPRGWMILSVIAIAPEFLATRSLTSTIALSLAGMILAQQALKRAMTGLAQLAGAWIAWRQVKLMFDAAANEPNPGSPHLTAATVEDSQNALEAYQLSYTYPSHKEPVLQHCSLTIRKGDAVLIEGGSGSGKSTFAAVIAGLRKPQSGLLLAGGLDPRTWGDIGWRKAIAAAPQYHENHILAAPLVFNLLMGRNWPPLEADLAEANEICRELGLGPLLERMPGGLTQMVGDTGWQLSQGERSRVYIARALLQQSRVVLLDESFAALDPENLKQCLECVLNRAKTLVVVAHP